MNDQIFRLEELIYEHKGITELISALSSLSGISLDSCTTGISILAKLSSENNKALEKVCEEMYKLEKAK